MQQLFVDYEYVNSTAARSIETLKSSYHDLWQEVFNKLQDIDNAWDGVDNDTYNEKFHSLQKDFEAMDNYLNNLYSYLVKSAEDYKTQQNNINNAAKNLKS